MRRRIVFISSNVTWGGSEVLWSQAAGILAARGHDVRAYKNRLSLRDAPAAQLKARGVKLFSLAGFPMLPVRRYSLTSVLHPHLGIAFQALRLHLSLRVRARPDLVVVSQGGNHDGWLLAAVCRRLKLPYVLVSQKATDLHWPQDRWLKEMRDNYRGALHAFFVSRHNLQLTQEQIGEPVSNASVVRNPFNVAYEARPPWPDANGKVGIACVGRLHPQEKGQDILLRVLARPEWRGRPVYVTFYGAGEQREGLAGMARFLGLENVRFAGHEDDVARIWAQHHLLALPSRAEGLPLALVETMLCGRVAVVSDVAGNAELLEDGVTGFVADAAAEESFAGALERAWNRRGDWQKIGNAAARYLRGEVPEDPPAAFADRLLRLLTPRR
jgi:glycosyltransferase involved in cell wall biosynthesis